MATTVPLLDFVPGTPAQDHATGLGDIRLEYFHIFRLGRKTLHGIGLELQMDTASKRQLGSDTTTLEPFYGISYSVNRYLQLVMVARYVKDVEVGFATPIAQRCSSSRLRSSKSPEAGTASFGSRTSST